jgi:hypothetical protein
MQEGSERGTGNAVMESWAEKTPSKIWTGFCASRAGEGTWTARLLHAPLRHWSRYRPSQVEALQLALRLGESGRSWPSLVSRTCPNRLHRAMSWMQFSSVADSDIVLSKRVAWFMIKHPFR